MTKDYIKKPHTSIFTGQIGCGKIHYNKHFDYIVIICLTLRDNSTDHAREWIKNDYKLWLVDPKDSL